MKKNVKKVENRGIDSTELIIALNELEKEKGIKKEYVFFLQKVEKKNFYQILNICNTKDSRLRRHPIAV